MTILPLTLALAALLMMPGPTNTLLAVAGAELGLGAARRLIPFEVAAYLLVTVPLALAGGQLAGLLPWLKPALTGIAGLWVMVLAARLWHSKPQGHSGLVTGRAVFFTTLLNPKGLVIGLALLPGPQLPLRTLIFTGLVMVVASVWAMLGAAASMRPTTAKVAAMRFRQVAAVWLAILSMGLLYSAALAAHP